MEPIPVQDWLTLYNTLLELKARYPAQAGCNRLVLLPSASTPVATVATFIDLVRHPLANGQPLANEEALRQAEAHRDMLLFPEVILRYPVH